MPDKLAYSVKEAAEALSISVSKLKEEMYQGRLQYKKMGRRVVIPRWALERWVETPATPAVSEPRAPLSNNGKH